MPEHNEKNIEKLAEDEEQLRVFENEGGSTYSEQMQDKLEPIEEDEDEEIEKKN